MKNIKAIFTMLAMGTMIYSCSYSRPIVATDNENKKEGVAEYNVFLGIIRPMDADISIEKAAKNGGITHISTVDSKVEAGLFKETHKTIVTGY